MSPAKSAVEPEERDIPQEQAKALSMAMWRNPQPGAIGFGAGVPDPALYPADMLGGQLGKYVSATPEDVMGYAYEPGHVLLREALARRHAWRDGARITAAQILLTNGSSGAIDHAARAIVEPGDVVLVEQLSYGAAVNLFRHLGAEVVTVPSDADGLMTEVLAQTIARVGSERVKALYCIPSCQNPTGTMLPEARRRAIARLAEQHDFFLLQDDTYGEIRFGDDPAVTFLSLAPDHALHLGSFSKTLAPGLRAGWLAASPAIIAKASAARTDLGTSPIIQRAIAGFFDDGSYDTHVAAVTAHYRYKRDRLIAAMESECKGLCEWQVPQGGFFLWCRMLTGDPERLMSAAYEEGVVFLPGSFFEVVPAGHAMHFRVAYAPVSDHLLEEGAARLGRALQTAAAA